MSKNTFFLIIVSVIALIMLGVGAYFYFFTDTLGGGIFSPSGTGTSGQGSGFSPFGKNDNTGNGSRSGENNQATGAGDTGVNGKEPVFTLKKLARSSVAGFIPQTIGSTTVVRYLEKEVGRVFDIDMSIPSSKTKITNTTIPKVYSAVFGKNGTDVLLRYLDDNSSIQTYHASIPVATSTEAITEGVPLKGTFLAENIRDVSVSPQNSRLFSLLSSGDSAVGVISEFNGSKKSQIFDSPFAEWLSSFPNEKTILLVTKPSFAITGSAYKLDSRSGSFQKIYGGAFGLTALLSPDEKNLLVSRIEGVFPVVGLYNIKDGKFMSMGLKTIADKCLWATNIIIYCGVPNTIPPANSGYPDAWYQGVVSFSDSIWKIDVEILSTELVSSISQVSKENVDAVNLSVDKNKNYLFFLNKRDSSLWSLRLQ